MKNYISGKTIKELREKKGWTQSTLAEKLYVSDKTISKWETGRGLPDISIIGELSSILGVTVAELFTGEIISNQNRAANLMKSKFYICPVCGNIICSTGEGLFSCCGISLVPELEEEDEKGYLKVQRDGNELYLSVEHDMKKTDYLCFFAYLTDNSAEKIRLYPEQEASGRFLYKGKGTIYVYGNRIGLIKNRI